MTTDSWTNWMRRAVGAAAVGLAVLAQPAFAVGLGNAEVLSRLNERLHVRIPLRGVRSGEAETLRARLADDAAFARAGLDRAALPTGIRLAVRGDGRGAYVEMRTREAVREPQVAFVLSVESRDEQVQRAYRLLIDFR